MPDVPNTNTPLPDEPSDPVDAELVAYLDGELDEMAAKAMESRLSGDARLRARASALKMTFDLLDFLPHPDPSPDFATRTVEKLPTTKSNPATQSLAPSTAFSSSVPAALSTGRLDPTTTRHSWIWTALASGIGVIAILTGYWAAAGLRHSTIDKTSHAPASAAPSTDDNPLPERVIELLPLYAVADTIEFVRELASDPELFNDEADGPGGVPIPPRVPWAADIPALAKAYRALPGERQNQLRQLDQQLHQLPPAERQMLMRALETYAVWLHHLSESERAGILSAANAKDRLEEVREVRRARWVASLPAVQQKQIKGLPAAERAALLAKWRDEETSRRNAWALPSPTRETIRLGKSPYPFDTEQLKKQVVDYARAAYRLDDKDKGRMRLTMNEHTWLMEAYELGRDEDSWLWFGKLLYDLSWRYEMLPEPDGRPPVTDIPHLWDAAKQYYAKGIARQRVQRYIGRWPEFALVAHEDLAQAKVGLPPPEFSFGPARPDEFREATRHFIQHELLPILRPLERLQLQAFEGRWPEYPRLLIQLSRAHDCSVPGAMLPGRPSEWDKTYGSSSRPIFRTKG